MTTPARAAGPAGFDAAEWLEEHAAGDIVMTPEGRVTVANRPARRILRLPAGRETTVVLLDTVDEVAEEQ